MSGERIEFRVVLMLNQLGVFLIGEGLNADWPGAYLALLAIRAVLAVIAFAHVDWFAAR